MQAAELLNSLEERILKTQADIAKVNYEASDEDFETVDGKKIYTEEFLNAMPSNYATLLGRFGTLMEIKSELEDSVGKDMSAAFDNNRFH